jgi:hypothetical protein
VPFVVARNELSDGLSDIFQKAIQAGDLTDSTAIKHYQAAISKLK